MIQVQTSCRKCMVAIVLYLTEKEHAAAMPLMGMRFHRPICDKCIAEAQGAQSEVIAGDQPST